MFAVSLSRTIDCVCVCGGGCLQGKPRPKVTWLKEGTAIDPTHVNIRNTDCDSIVFIRKAERSHSGKYEMTVQVENHVDTAVLDIQVVGNELFFLQQIFSKLKTMIIKRPQSLSLIVRPTWASSVCEH